MRDLHADRGRQAIAHGAKAAGCHPPVGIFEPQILRRPHLVLAHFGRDVAISVLGQRLKPFQRVLGLDRFGRGRIGEALLLTPAINLRPPGLHISRFRLGAARFPDLQHVFQYNANVADDRNIDLDVLVD